MAANHSTKFFTQRDVLLGHQWHCELNYLYLEALHRNIPLVHNSTMLHGAGYYYPEHDIQQGKDALLQAINDKKTKAYHDNAKAALARFSIHNPEVQASYHQLLDEAMSQRII